MQIYPNLSTNENIQEMEQVIHNKSPKDRGGEGTSERKENDS